MLALFQLVLSSIIVKEVNWKFSRNTIFEQCKTISCKFTCSTIFWIWNDNGCKKFVSTYFEDVVNASIVSIQLFCNNYALEPTKLTAKTRLIRKNCFLFQSFRNSYIITEISETTTVAQKKQIQMIIMVESKSTYKLLMKTVDLYLWKRQNPQSKFTKLVFGGKKYCFWIIWLSAFIWKIVTLLYNIASIVSFKNIGKVRCNSFWHSLPAYRLSALSAFRLLENA